MVLNRVRPITPPNTTSHNPRALSCARVLWGVRVLSLSQQGVHTMARCGRDCTRGIQDADGVVFLQHTDTRVSKARIS